MSLKLGIVTEYYYPLLGGISENVHNTALRLRDKGHEVKIITSKINGSQNGSRPPVEVIRIGRSASIYSNGSLARLTLGLRLKSEIRAVLEREKFDLLHLHSPLVPTLPMMALYAAQCPTVGTFHTYFERSFWYSLLKGTVQKNLIQKMSGQIAVSRSCIDSLSRFFEINARIIPNGVDVRQFDPAIPRLPRFDDGKMNLLFLGRLDPRNGLALMIEVFRLVKARFPAVRLIIVGDGPLKKYYKHMVSDDISSDIHLAGPVLGERNRYYSSCDVFCSPVEKASFGITLLEAMASGKPIVATENSGYRELLGPGEGSLVEPHNPEAFANAILALLKDPELRKQMGESGRAKALEFSWDAITSEIDGYYEEILNNRWY